MTKQLIAAAAIAATILGVPTAHADNSVARLTAVSGNVLVSNASTIATAGEALRLAPGMRVLVTTNSAATIEFHDGCRVRVDSGGRFEVQAATPCAQGAFNQTAAVAQIPVRAAR